MDIVAEAELLEEALDIIAKHGYSVKKLDEAETETMNPNASAVTFRDTDFTKVCEKYLASSFFAMLAREKSLEFAINAFLNDIKQFVGHGISEKYYRNISARLRTSKTAADAMFKISNAMLAGGGHAVV